MLTAITRGVSPALQSCQLEFFDRRPIDIAKATAQHSAYQDCLRALSIHVISLPPDPDSPDSVFVEDPAIVLDELAVITRMGTGARRREAESLSQTLASLRPIKRITEPATLEGGDVLRVGKTLYVGLSRRTNHEGLNQLSAHVEAYGYKVKAVEVKGCLHLKTACTSLGEARVIANKELFDAAPLSDFEIIEVPPQEPCAANVLHIQNVVIVPAAFPRTAEKISHLGFEVKTLDISELAKAEAGPTCMSLIFRREPHVKPATAPATL